MVWPTQIGVETIGGEALRIVETDTKIQRSLEAASAVTVVCTKCLSRFGGLSMGGNDKEREEG